MNHIKKSNFWKIGTRWSKNGLPNTSILSLMRRNNIAFVWLEGKKKEKFLNCVKENDYIALSDGFQIVAIGKVIGEPKLLKEFSNFVITNKDKTEIDIDSNIVGVRISLVDISEEDAECFKYKNRTRFCQLNKENLKIKSYYDDHFNSFDIKSYTENILNLFNDKASYIVPVYQRPYEWKSSQVEPFINDILSNFFGKEGNVIQEPIFIGTIQLSKRKLISNNEYQHDIIDGQQRITTLIIFIKELQKKYPNESILFRNKEYLSTHVSKTQNDYLQDYLSNIETNKDQNQYWKNAKIISEIFDRYLEDQPDTDTFKISDFLDYLYKKVIFVVIETSAGLSKTIKIFNTINNAGLDLNGNDLFKIRMYEYLRDIKNKQEEVFDEIQNLYSLIDEKNKTYGKEYSMGTMLDIYKNILITEYNLSNALYELSWETFFDRLFDSLLVLNNDWDDFKKLNGLELNINTLKNIIELRYIEGGHSYSLEASFANKMIHCFSRYRRLRGVVIYPFLYYYYNNNQSVFSNLEELLITLNKYFFIYSLYHSKQISKVRTDIFGMVKSMKENPVDGIIRFIRKEINTIVEKEGHRLKNQISKNLFGDGSRWWKYLVCGVSTFLSEREDGLSIETLQEKIFDTSKFDIEHIHANNDSSIVISAELQNSIGNLTHLEREINRGIKDKEFPVKKIDYKKSKYKTVRDISEYEKWDSEEIENRLKTETENIYNYIRG